MFQNISKDFEEEKQNKDVEFNKKNRLKDVLQKSFSKQMIILYVVTFLLSLVSFQTEQSLAPFGVAIVVATLSSCKPIGIVGVLATIGAAISQGSHATLNLLLTLMLVFFSILIRSPKFNEEENEKRKLGTRLIISILIVELIQLLFKEIIVYDIIYSIIYSISAYIFYKIFVNSIEAVTNIGSRKAYSIEEIMGASLILAIATCSMKAINIYGYSIKNILCILIVLIMGWKNGILVGGAAGITIGSVIGIIGGSDPTIIATYALSRNDSWNI